MATPEEPTVRLLRNPGTLEGPTTIDQFDRMKADGQLASLGENRLGWEAATAVHDSIREKAHDTKMRDNRPDDLNPVYNQVVLQNGEDVSVFCKDPEKGEVRYQERTTSGGVQYRREYVSLGDYAIYGLEWEAKGQRHVETYHFLPNGTIREESSVQPMVSSATG